MGDKTRVEGSTQRTERADDAHSASIVGYVSRPDSFSLSIHSSISVYGEADETFVSYTMC